MAEENKTHWRSCDKTDFLGAADLDESHGDLVAVISHVRIEKAKIRGQQKEARVAYFKEKGLKPMIINVFNGKILKKWTGSKYVEDWNNIPVSIYVLEGIKFGSEITEGLRFRDKQPNLEKQELTKDYPRYNEVIEKLTSGGTTVEKVKEFFSMSKSIEKELQDAANLS